MRIQWKQCCFVHVFCRFRGKAGMADPGATLRLDFDPN